jgi:hypothetical protein
MRHIGRKPKIDKRKLHNMLRQGRSQTECAKYFGVSPSAINQAKKNLTLGIAKNVTLETGAVIVKESLDSLSQLKKINDHTNRLVDLIAGWIDGDPDAIKTLQRHHRLGGNALSFKDPKELLLKAIQEVRSQVKLSLDIYESLYNMRTIQAFQEEVLNVIAKQNPEVRDEIVKRLKQRNAVRSVMRIT